MALDEHCRSAHAPWSAIVAAPNNAAFAALLTGFMITAIAFLLGRERREDKLLHAVALFAPGLLVLALACNQFVGISAIAPPAGDAHQAEIVCSVAWTQGMAASGMLGVGFVVAVTGLVWMMAHTVDGNIRLNTQESDARDRRTLVHLGNFLVFVAIVSVSLLLTRTAIGYYAMMGDVGLRPSTGSNFAMWSIFAAMTVVSVIIISARTILYYRARRKGLRGEWIERDESTVKRVLRRAFLAGVVVLTAGMALIVPLHSGIVAQSDSVPGAAAAFFAIALGMLLPFVIFLFISASVPGPDFWYWEAIFATKERHEVIPLNEGAGIRTSLG